MDGKALERAEEDAKVQRRESDRAILRGFPVADERRVFIYGHSAGVQRATVFAGGGKLLRN